MKLLLRIVGVVTAVCVLSVIVISLRLLIPTNLVDTDYTKTDYAVDGFQLFQNSKGEILIPKKRVQSLAIMSDSLTIDNGRYILKMDISQAMRCGVDTTHYKDFIQYLAEMNEMNDRRIANGDSVRYWNLSSFRSLLHRAAKEGSFASE